MDALKTHDSCTVSIKALHLTPKYKDTFFYEFQNNYFLIIKIRYRIKCMALCITNLCMLEEEVSLQKDKDEHPDENPTKTHLVRTLNISYETRLNFQGVVHQVSEPKNFEI